MDNNVQNMFVSFDYTRCIYEKLINSHESLGLEKNLFTNQKYGIWNGDEFVFIDSDWYIISLLKLFYRYGFQPYNLKRYLKII